MAAAQPMSGVYTVKQAGGGDYSTILAALADVRTRGFAGDVRIDVYNGTYAGAVSLESIGNGAHRLVLRVYPGDSATVDAGGNLTAIRLFNNQRIHIEGFTVANYTWSGVDASSTDSILNTTDSCAVVRCKFPPVGISRAAIAWRYGDCDTITDNTIRSNADYDILLSNSYNANCPARVGNVISGNRITSNRSSSGYYAIFAIRQDTLQIVGNTINRPGEYGLYLYGVKQAVVSGNVVNVSSGYGVYIDGGGLSYKRIFVNNLVTAWSHALFAYYCNNLTTVNNSLLSTGTGGYPYYDQQSSVESTYNNILKRTGGYAYYKLGGSAYPAGSNYNVYSNGSPGSNIVYSSTGGGAQTLAAWRVAGGVLRDGQSFEAEPLFVSATSPYDLHLQATSPCRDTCDVYSPYVRDVDGDVRPYGVRNDIGGDEWIVAVPDVGVTGISAPSGTLDSGTTVVPACSVWSSGTTTENYRVRMRIGVAYNDTALVSGHAPGTGQYVTFPAWTAGARGDYAVSCSTELATDVNHSNDRQTGTVDVAVHDVAAVAVLAPAGTINPGPVVPQASVRNEGTHREACSVTFGINFDPAYSETVSLPDGLPFADTTLDFPAWDATPGDYVTTVTADLAGDQVPANNTAGGTVTVELGLAGGWAELAPVPLMPSGRAVKDGGWLAWDASQGKVFAAKGYKTGDFYCYEPVSGAWTELAPWPLGNEAKPPYKGSAGTSDGAGRVYATKGNNNTGFWRYDAGANAWTQLADVPLGVSNKKVKGGTDLVYVDEVDSQYVYLLKGYKTEFYRYNTYSGAWYVLADAPAGALPKWDKGSWLAYDGVGQIYAHKAKNHELYAYDLGTQTWGPALTGMPLVNNQTGKSKKSKDGGCGIFSPGGWGIWALKGGNTQDYYWLDLGTMAWAEKETIPAFGYTAKKKKVKAGADIVTDGEVLYALKGNKTLEFWRYVPAGLQPTASGPRPDRDGVQEQRNVQGATCKVEVVQNPARGTATIRWTGLPSGNPTRLTLYDAAGRCVRTTRLAGGSGGIELRDLAAGVYLARVTGGASLTRKLVIE
jgi:hypothetical protein